MRNILSKITWADLLCMFHWERAPSTMESKDMLPTQAQKLNNQHTMNPCTHNPLVKARHHKSKQRIWPLFGNLSRLYVDCDQTCFWNSCKFPYYLFKHQAGIRPTCGSQEGQDEQLCAHLSESKLVTTCLLPLSCCVLEKGARNTEEILGLARLSNI